MRRRLSRTWDHCDLNQIHADADQTGDWDRHQPGERDVAYDPPAYDSIVGA